MTEIKTNSTSVLRTIVKWSC